MEILWHFIKELIYSVMKKILTLILLLSWTVAFGQTAMFNTSLTLGDQEKHVMPYYPNDNPCRDQENTIAEKFIAQSLNSALLKAVGISEFENDVKDALTANIVGAYNNEHTNPVIYRVRIFYNEEFNKFLHKLLKTSRMKDLLFDFSSDIICDLCKLYPKDFKADAITRIKSAISFVSTMKNHTYEAVDLDTWMHEQKLYIDGKENEEVALGIEGFLIRRVIFDGFTIQELSGYLEKLLAKIETVDVKDNSDVLKSVRINDDLTYYMALSGNYYFANKTGVKILPYNPELSDVQRFGETQLQCIKDGNSNLYKISNGYLDTWPEEKWVLYEHPAVKGVMLIDDKGEVILKE